MSELGTVVAIRYSRKEDLASNEDLLAAYVKEEHGKIEEDKREDVDEGIGGGPLCEFVVWFPTLWSATWFLTKAVTTILSDIYSVRLIGDGPEYDRQVYQFMKQDKKA